MFLYECCEFSQSRVVLHRRQNDVLIYDLLNRRSSRRVTRLSIWIFLVYSLGETSSPDVSHREALGKRILGVHHVVGNAGDPRPTSDGRDDGGVRSYLCLPQ